MSNSGKCQKSVVSENPFIKHIRKDIPGRFNEVDMIKRQWSRIVSNMQGNIIPPYEVIIHPSSTCNLCCVWCIGDHVPIEENLSIGNGKKNLDAAKTNISRLPNNLTDVKNILRVMTGILEYKKIGLYAENGRKYTKEFKVENVSFSGLIGEPLVAKDAVLSAMRLLVDNGIRVGLYTNGLFMDEATLGILVEIGYINLSLDAGKAETYKFLRCGRKKKGKMQFNQVLQNLKKLVKKRNSTPGSTLDINASFVLYPENYVEIFEAARILKDTGVGILRVKQDVSRERLLNTEQRKKALDLVNRIKVKLVDKQFKFVEIHRLNNTEEMRRSCATCLISELMGAIGSDGNLYPCNYHPRPGGVTYGNAINTAFGEIWEGEKRREVKGRLPHICPSVCDPFKSRSNKLLSIIKNTYRSEGLHKLEAYKEEVIESLP